MPCGCRPAPTTSRYGRIHRETSRTSWSAMGKSSSCRSRIVAEHPDWDVFGRCRLPWTCRMRTGCKPGLLFPLAADTVIVAIESMRVGLIDGKAPISHIAAVEIGRWRRDADVGIGWLTAEG